jgi:hypothetical protein
MTRDQMIKDCPDGCEKWAKEIIDYIETRVNSAKDQLLGIKSINDLERVQECLDELQSLARDLY